MKKWILAPAVAMAMAWGGAAVAQDEEVDCPERDLVKSGTFTMNVKAVGLIVGARWGEGTLTLNSGETYNFSLEGAKLGDIGASETEVSGTIYNLEKLEDFEGIYLGIGGGLAVATATLGGSSITNGACVVMNATERDGAGLSASMPVGPGGVSVEFES